jgi:hypothetical protein
MQLCNSAMYYGARETIHNLLPSPTKTGRPEPGLRAVKAILGIFTFSSCHLPSATGYNCPSSREGSRSAWAAQLVSVADCHVDNLSDDAV